MYKLVKWIWRRAYERGQDTAMFEIYSLAQYHRQESQIMAMRDKYEPRKDSDDEFMRFVRPPLTADQHKAVANALEELANRISPPPQPPREEIKMDIGVPQL